MEETEVEKTEAEFTASEGSNAEEIGGEGLMYQEPQRSLATRGKAKALETVSVKAESERIERSRLRRVGWELAWRGRWERVGETSG